MGKDVGFYMVIMNLSTKNPFRRQPQLILQMPENEGWCPWDRLDDSHDDGLRSNTSAMRFKYKVITWEPLLEDA